MAEGNLEEILRALDKASTTQDLDDLIRSQGSLTEKEIADLREMGQNYVPTEEELEVIGPNAKEEFQESIERLIREYGSSPGS